MNQKNKLNQLLTTAGPTRSRIQRRKRLQVELLEGRRLLTMDVPPLLDINATHSSVSSNPQNFADIGGITFFAATTATTGSELWKSDGTAAGTVLVKDISAGISSSYLSNLTNVNGTLYFRATDGVDGHELWKSDGTAAGTVLVKDIWPGGFSSSPRYLTNVNGTLYFSANDGFNGHELWKSDGTAAGTVLVKEIRTGGFSSYPRYLTNVNGTLYFRATDGVNGEELWKSDGTATGTVLVKDIIAGSSSSSPRYLTNVNGTLYFRATDGMNGYELWKSDGTEAGTVQVLDIAPGTAGSSAALLFPIDNRLFFAATTDSFGFELYVIPSDIRLSANSVDENLPLDTVVGVFSVSDSESVESHSYALVDGTGSQDNAWFTIDGNTLKTAAPFDFETKTSYSIRVRTTNDGGLSFDKAFTVNVTNVNEAPTALVLTPSSLSLPEDSNTDSAIDVATIAITDDALGTNTLTLTGADAESFEISGNQLRIKSGVILDFETKSTYLVSVNVDDNSVGNTPDATANFTLTLTDINEDLTAPASAVQPLPANATSLVIPINVMGSDVLGAGEASASGVKEYDLYVAVNSGAFAKFATVPAGNPNTAFAASSNRTYFFRSVARDHAGNEEVKAANYADAFTRVADLDIPITQVDSASVTPEGLFTLSISGSEVGGSQLTSFELFVSTDGALPVSIGSVSAGMPTNGTYSATAAYQAPADGISRTYRFYSLGRDSAGNVEDVPTTADFMATASFAAPSSLQATGINVQRGATQRSFITDVDLLFNNAVGVDSLLTAGRIVVERFALNATNVTAGLGTAVAINSLQQNGSNIRIGFGSALAHDGFYRVRADVNNDGDFDDPGESFEFHRLRGDANGDAIINSLDTAVVDSLFGRVGIGLEGDLDGNGVVNSTDKSFTLRTNVGRKLADPLKVMLDD